MSIDAIKTVAVIGAGTMGNGIAHVFARAGFSVILKDIDQRFLDRGMETISKNLDREVKKGKLAEVDKSGVLARVQATTDATTLSRADFCVEAVPERLELKLSVLREADSLLRPGVILASNTSSIAITTLAAATKRPENFIGMHFMNPVPVMTLVEVIRALQTSDATFATTVTLCEKLEKKPVAVNDAPGFVSNRVLMPMINEAAFCVMEGVATPEAVDVVMIIQNDKGMQRLLSSNFQVGGDASAAAGPVGRHAEAGTDWKMDTEILTYSRAKGAFAGLTLEGASIRQDNDSRDAITDRMLPREPY